MGTPLRKSVGYGRRIKKPLSDFSRQRLSAVVGGSFNLQRASSLG